MTLLALALLTNTGASGNGESTSITIQREAGVTVEEIIASLGIHNIVSAIPNDGDNTDTLTLRHWQTEANVPLPNAKQLADAEAAAIAANLRLEAAQQEKIAKYRLEAQERLGENIARILDSGILASNPPVQSFDVKVIGQWLYAIATDSQLQDELENIRGARNGKRHSNK